MSHLLDLSKGYLRVPRWLFDPQHPLSPQRARNKQPVSRREALLDLLALVIWKVGGRGDINRGEVRTSVSFLAVRWSWSESKVRRFLRLLKEDGTIRWHPGTGNETGVIGFPTYGAINPPPPGKSRKGGGASEPPSGTLPWRPPAVSSRSLNSTKRPDRVEPHPGPLMAASSVTVERIQENQEVTASYQEGWLDGRPEKARGKEKKRETHPSPATYTDPWEARAVAEGESGDCPQVPPKKNGRAKMFAMSVMHDPADEYRPASLSEHGSPPEHDLLPDGETCHDEQELEEDEYLRAEREGMALF